MSYIHPHYTTGGITWITDGTGTGATILGTSNIHATNFPQSNMQISVVKNGYIIKIKEEYYVFQKLQDMCNEISKHYEEKTITE